MITGQRIPVIHVDFIADIFMDKEIEVLLGIDYVVNTCTLRNHMQIGKVNIIIALAYCRHHLLTFHDTDIDLNTGMVRGKFMQTHSEDICSTGEHSNSYVTVSALSNAAHAAFSLILEAEYLSGILHKLSAFGCERHTVTVALEQRNTETVFEVFQIVADSRLCYIKLICCFCEVKSF